MGFCRLKAASHPHRFDDMVATDGGGEGSGQSRAERTIIETRFADMENR